MNYLSQDTFTQLCIEHRFDVSAISAAIKALGYGDTRKRNIVARITNYQRRGLLPLDSGNIVTSGTILKGTSTLHNSDGDIVLQWVKTDVPSQSLLDAFSEAISEILVQLPSLPAVPVPSAPLLSDLATLYISNDLHIGALMWDKESGSDWNTELAASTIRSAYDYLFTTSPNSSIGVVCDLGDLMEVDNDKSMTPKSGNILATDSRFPKILRVAYESLIYAINCALTKHDTVYFYNIVGNHDINSALAVREVIRVAFANNPRVIVDCSPINIKYHQHGSTLLGFAHGDGLKMRDAGEVMAHDCQAIFSSTKHRFMHFGHTHRDAVYDSPVCRSESHRNLAPLNHWAFNMGYRSGAGTMKSITYDSTRGEISRSIYTIQ